jgi:hypothetical protein
MPSSFVDSRINQNLEVATEYFRALMSYKDGDKVAAGSIGFLPFNINFTMDGIGGIKIYNELSVDTSFLPPGYTNTTDFIITGVDHKISNGDWETNVTTTLIPRTSPIVNIITGSLQIFGQVETAPVIPPAIIPTSTPGTPQVGNTETSRANNLYAVPYGVSPLQTPEDAQSSAYTALLKTIYPPFPLIYSGTILNVNQSLVNANTGVTETVKMSDLTYDYPTNTWKNSSGTKYKNKASLTVLKLKVHKDVHDSLINAFTQIKAAYGMEQVWNLGINTSSGTYVPRYKRGGNTLSLHSWGVAIDLLAGLNPLNGPNSKSPKAQFSKPEYAKFISIMEQNGWLSLGKNSNYDWMHFQTVTY